MHRALVPTLLLAVAALTSGATMPVAALPEGRDDPHTLTDCELIKALFCTKANQVVESNQLRTWQLLDDFGDYNDYVDKTVDIRYDDLWTYPTSQSGRLQRSFVDYRVQYGPNYSSYWKEAPPGRMVYFRNRDILVKDEKVYYAYDTYVGNGNNPFDFLSVRFICRAPLQAVYDDPASEIEDLEDQQTEEINPSVEEFVGKRADDAGQKEVPDNLVFSDEEKASIQKKLFALWSRMQSLTPKGRNLPSRRHTFVFYGRDGALSAETRAAAARLRPPGQPLRWG